MRFDYWLHIIICKFLWLTSWLRLKLIIISNGHSREIQAKKLTWGKADPKVSACRYLTCTRKIRIKDSSPFLLFHSWYHFLSLYLSMRACAEFEKFSASFIILWVLSSSSPSFSPRSTANLCALEISPPTEATWRPAASKLAEGPGMCLAIVRDGFPLLSPTKMMKTSETKRQINLIDVQHTRSRWPSG